MINDFEPVMTALFAHLEAAATITFTANATAHSAVLANVSNFVGIFAGLPVFGPGISSKAVVQSYDATAKTITLSSPAGTTGTAAAFTTGFLTTGRRVKHWSQVSDQPALFLRRVGTTDVYRGDLSITTIDCEAWIYCNAGQDPNAAPDQALTCLERMVRDSIVPEDGNRFTLRGLVYWCRIDGRSDISPGDQGSQAIARIPILVTLP